MFDRSMRDKLTPATAERRLGEALDQGQFRLYYQPIVSLWTKRLVGTEALLRWHDPNRGIVGPDEFLAALEQTGLIVPVGNWVLDEVCRQSARWQADFPDRPALNMKVNVSPRQLRNPGSSALRSAWRRVRPTRITSAEVNERACWSTSSRRGQLRSQGARGELALGDFRNQLFVPQVPAHDQPRLLSIDRSFVAGICGSRGRHDRRARDRHGQGPRDRHGGARGRDRGQMEALRSAELRPGPGLVLPAPHSPRRHQSCSGVWQQPRVEPPEPRRTSTGAGGALDQFQPAPPPRLTRQPAPVGCGVRAFDDYPLHQSPLPIAHAGTSDPALRAVLLQRLRPRRSGVLRRRAQVPNREVIDAAFSVVMRASNGPCMPRQLGPDNVRTVVGDRGRRRSTDAAVRVTVDAETSVCS
jgi:EAL domain-containing protein (putative c-di-GMP-specific phosphodiesterase class I)